MGAEDGRLHDAIDVRRPQPAPGAAARSLRLRVCVRSVAIPRYCV